MSTEAAELRAAARLMRGVAEDAAPGPWRGVEAICDGDNFAAVVGAGGDEGDPNTWLVATGRRPPGSNSPQHDVAHIVGMHPGVAIAVAVLLGELSEHAEHGKVSSLVLDGLEVARIYLKAIREVPE